MKMTRRKARAWLAPMLRCLHQMREGEIESINGYAVTRLHDGDDYARIDYCIAGFRALIERLCIGVDLQPLERIEKRLANGVLLEVEDIDAALRLAKPIEDALIKHKVSAVKDAVMAEQCVIELDRLGMLEAA